MNIGSYARFWRTALPLAVVATICSAGTIAAPAADTQVTVAHATTLRQGDAVVGALPMGQPMHVVVALKMRNRAALDTFIANASRNRTAGRAQPMSQAQFLADHAPMPEQAQAVANYLTSKGYRNVVITPDRLLISADGTATTARDAFQTSFAQVRTHDGRIAFANTHDVRIPTALNDSILSVLGLQTVHQAHTLARTIKPDAVHPNTTTGHNPVEFASIYNAVGIPGGPFGSGGPRQERVPVGIIAEGDLAPTIADLNTFIKNNGLPPTVNAQVVNVGGKSADTRNTVEWDLDSQTIVATGGAVVALRFFVAPSLSDADLTADYYVAAHNIDISRQDGYSPVINVSLGECELDAEDSGAAAAQDQIFILSAARGRTFSVATGDSGSDACGDGSAGASWPAASQYVVAVGGTTLNASTTTWSSETVWGGSGGSPSRFEPKPIWQYALIPGSTRGVPDVAFDADPDTGALIVVNGKQEQVGGTGLAASIFTGLWTRAILWPGDDSVSYVFGFAGPNLYLLPQPYFHDVTAGSNGGYRAGVGYDFASGRGSLILGTAINQLGLTVGNPPVADFSFAVDDLQTQFTDHSTSSDGTIVGRIWDFRDGSPVLAATNPSHTYAGAGTYQVLETVSDNSSNIAEIDLPVTVAPPGLPNQLIGNTGFEDVDGKRIWRMTPGVLCNTGSSEAADCGSHFAPIAHGGYWFARLDGYGHAHTDTVSQQITIPTGKTSATLAFWLQISTDEIDQTRAFDQLTVGVYDPSGTLLGTLATFSNLDKSSGYQLHTCDMSPWIGQTVVLQFTGKEDASLATEFALDDVTVQVE